MNTKLRFLRLIFVALIAAAIIGHEFVRWRKSAKVIESGKAAAPRLTPEGFAFSSGPPSRGIQV